MTCFAQSNLPHRYQFAGQNHRYPLIQWLDRSLQQALRMSRAFISSVCLHIAKKLQKSALQSLFPQTTILAAKMIPPYKRLYLKSYGSVSLAQWKDPLHSIPARRKTSPITPEIVLCRAVRSKNPFKKRGNSLSASGPTDGMRLWGNCSLISATRWTS